MATSFILQSPKSSSSVVRLGSSANNANDHNLQRIVSLASSSPSGVPSVRFQFSKRKNNAALQVKASLNEVTAEKYSKSAPKETNGSVTKRIPDEASISAFMAQVTDLIKLVDAKDITELSIKQQDCEFSIKKKEAFQAAPVAAPVMSMSPSFYSAHSSPPPPPPAAVAAPHPASSALALPPPAAKKPSSSHPPLKCPMAGTFYRSPAPGEPAFVKVGDKVQKGQVICIIEAMKLMNEIEADQSGTITEILLDDGKPVSIDTPLFVIAP